MRIPTPYSKRKARIEIIPLIDIVFFLLATFVMVSLSMIKNQAIPVNLPAATTSAPQERKDSVSLSITGDGSLYVDKELIRIEELPGHLSRLKSSQPDLKVFIHGDEKASFGDTVQVLDEVRKQGLTKVAIQTTHRQEESRQGMRPS